MGKRPTGRRVGRSSSSYVHYSGLLTPKQVQAARTFAASEPVQEELLDAELFDGGASQDRKSRVAWLDTPGCTEPVRPQYPPWLHARLRDCARETHRRLGNRWCPVGRDKRGNWTPRYEPLQYAEYTAGGHYGGWHTDAELGDEDPEDARCVTVVLLLSDSADYAGGHLEVKLGGHRNKPSRVPLRAGDAIGFPARRLWHRVTKCRSGLRQSIVFWVCHNCKRPESRFEEEDPEEPEEPEEEEEEEQEDSPSKAA